MPFFVVSDKSLMNPSATVFSSCEMKTVYLPVYPGYIMGQNPAHSTHSDQQSVDLRDSRNGLKLFINYIAVGVK